jgi:hypothetical protein
MNEQGEGTEPKRPPWSPQDSRTWIITFGAGLAANLATVLVIGAAVAYLHFARANLPHHRLPTEFWKLQAAVLGAMVVGGVVVLVLLRGPRGGLWARIASGLIVLCLFLTLLVWIGAAAGIK